MAPVEFQSRGTIEQIKVKLHFLSVFMFDLREFERYLFFSCCFFSSVFPGLIACGSIECLLFSRIKT